MRHKRFAKRRAIGEAERITAAILLYARGGREWQAECRHPPDLWTQK
jgi:hypothetical protein